jgi:P-type Cu+ transporter
LFWRLDVSSAEIKTPSTTQTEAAGCFHCGEPCRSLDFAIAEKTFCCQGCLVVHDLLTASGLGRFYELGARPGIRSRTTADREQWAYLDESFLQRQLLDFTDGKTSRVTFHIPAIHCIACVWLLENLSRINPGIIAAQVNFPRREVVIRFATDQIRLSEVVALLVSIGYEPALTLDGLEKRKSDPARRRQWLQIGVAGFAFGNVMLLSLPLYLGLDTFNAPLFKSVFGYLSLGFALPVLIFSASDYWRSAWLAMRRRSLTLDVPIALGLAAIYAQSVWEIVAGHGEGYLDSMSGLVFFLLCGRAFQQKTHERLAFDRDYKSFFPLAVRRLKSIKPEGELRGILQPTDQHEEIISLSHLQVGDRILVRNGELIPADATLANGAALVDYSFVTGESEPIAKQPGDYLYAGGKQIGAAIEVETVKAVSQSYLTSLWNHDAFQKERDDNLNTLTNRYSRRFTFLVIAVALGSALFWIVSGNRPRGIKAFISVLIVACPCALALAAPFTLGTAQRLLTRARIFLKNALVIERMARVDAIVFDKTGTLTAAGTSRVLFEGLPISDEEKSLVFSLARQSTHPLSAKLAEGLANGSPAKPVEVFVETPGCGVAGRVLGHDLRIGSHAWLKSPGFDSPSSTSLNGSRVGVAIDGEYRGTFELAGSLRANVAELISQLASRYELALLSGDNARETERFRALFGSDARLHFNQSPLDKLGFIRRLQDSGKTVMMVGDGLNDAGALKQSDVGVAVVENVGAFSPGSDVILEAGNVPRLFEILLLARRSARIVRASFGISAAYNLVGIGIAAAGVLSPLVCAVLMPVSSVSVVLFACATTAWSARTILGRAVNPLAAAPEKRNGGSGVTRPTANSGVRNEASLPLVEVPL